jgi:hypothetical protein
MDKIKRPVYNKLPNQVRVLGKIFKIRFMKDDEWEDADGIMELDSQNILVREKKALAYMQDTLLHETIHAIDETLITGMTEQQVSNIASVLLAVLKDNPEFTSWILQNE